MNKIIFNAFLFTAGAVVGSLVTWKFVKDKYDRIAQEEIDSVKEMWARRMYNENEEDDDCIEKEEDEEDPDPDQDNYRELTRMYKQSDNEVENGREGAGDEEVPYINGPYVITPEEFGDGNYNHDMYALTYYADGILSNDWYEELDIDETIGEESLEHFGDHVDDVLYVRNERLNADYEITRDPRNYSDMIVNDPLMGAYAN